MQIDLLLASASPRRKELLAACGLLFHVFAPNVDERRVKGESPRAMVGRLARVKALAALPKARELAIGRVLAADTTVALADKALGKPKDASEAKRMLRSLSGRAHMVYTGVCLALGDGTMSVRIVGTRVHFRALSAADIERYVKSGECFDKAGAYAIQGLGGSLVRTLGGSYTNVIGLPMAEVLTLLGKE